MLVFVSRQNIQSKHGIQHTSASFADESLGSPVGSIVLMAAFLFILRLIWVKRS